MEKLRVGIVGIGAMGGAHAKTLMNGEVPGAILTAVCDTDPKKLEWAGKELGESVLKFDNLETFLECGELDGVIIATPHYDHPPIAIKSFEKGLHVLVEKPAGVYTKQVREMNEAAEKSGKVFCIMYCLRTNPTFSKVREIIKSGELGSLKRTNWIITTCYRSQSYYNSGGWRATWKGEGGGVLLNQSPHQLDLWQWICGMPVRVRAFMGFGKYHNIEVEDDVTAYVEYDNGATGIFLSSTGETPGSNRLEIVGDRGKLVLEDDKIVFWELEIPERQFNKDYQGGFGQPDCRKCEIKADGEYTLHAGIMRDWVSAIFKGTPLLAPGYEGIKGLQISNAMHLSAWLDDWASIPVDEDLFYRELNKRIASSKDKDRGSGIELNLKKSY
ncbi:MAG: Gfo/Idh/MocA family oxidoreductase [Eubacteriales bacterium]|nr:Gfo/Idh/MocA family oxidoreductase [Eubacteriales bacterium]